MRAGTLQFSERISFGAPRCVKRFAVSPLRSRGRTASFSSCGRAGFDAVGRGGNPGAGAGGVSFRARTWRDRAGAEPAVSGRIGSGKARADRDGAGHAADVCCGCRSEACGTDLWETERTQGAGAGRGGVERAMAARGNRALFLMDLGVPRNIDAKVAELYNVYVYNTDDLTEIVQQNRNARESEIPHAQGIVEEHVSKSLSWQASVELVGLVDALRTKLREERATFIRSRMEPMKHLSETDRAQVEKLMDEMLEKVLLEPAQRLRGEKELRRKIQNVEALRDLFLLNREKP